MPTDIKLKNSVTATNAPTSLQQGEVAINITDKKVWVGNAATTPVLLLGSGADGTFTNLTVSGVANFADGTVSLPSITNIGDTNTGIYFPAADTIAFTEGGVESMRIDSSGNVGIGNSAPATKLDVTGAIRVGTAADAGILYVGTNNYAIIQKFATEFRAGWTRDAIPLTYLTNDTERMRIDSSGNVLINTSATRTEFNSRLLIEGTTSNATGSIAVINNNASAASGYIALGKTRGAIGSNTTVVSGDSLGSLVFYGADGTGLIYSAGITATSEGTIATGQIPSRMSFSTANSAGTVTERMRITSAGEVLVGGTTELNSFSGGFSLQRTNNAPNFNLYRNDTSVSSGNVLGAIAFWGNDTTSNTPTTLAYINGIASGDHAAGDNPTDLAFGTTADGSATVTERMRIDSSGNVLIGKTSATANGGDLQVSSGITFPATQVAKSDANTLDDYEEGTFTPTIIGLSTAGTGTYTTQVGTYTKIGNTVTVAISLTWTAHTGSGTMAISSLPFTAATAVSREWMAIPEFVNMTMPASTIPFAYIGSAFTNIRLNSMAVGTGATTALALDTAATVYLSLTYLTA